MRTIAELTSVVPQIGRVEAVLVRPDRREPPRSLDSVMALTGLGLDGDRHARRAVGRAGTRHVTLIQAEHLVTIAALLGRPEALDPSLLRRNLVVRGIPLLALKGLRFTIGDAVLEGTGPCHPCSRMEEALGVGGYQAMRGHGGITAVVIEGGQINVGESVTALPAADDA